MSDKIEDLKPDPRNTNRGTERGLAMLEDSLRKYGAGRSILVDKTGAVIAGNKTLERAADLGLPVRVVKTDGRELVVVQREDLDLDDKDGRARKLAYADNRSSQVGLDWDVEQILADVQAGVDLSGLWRDNELASLLEDILPATIEYDEEPELSEWDVPDALWPSDNEWGIPTLDSELQGEVVELPVCLWGAVGRTHKMPGTWLFYCDDYRFEALWKNPSGVVNSGCSAVVEANFTIGPQIPRAVALWQIYRKRWMARWWQSHGIKVIVDMNVSTEAFGDIMLLGVPVGWRSYATRAYQDRMALTLDEYELACHHAGTEKILFLLYGGGQNCRDLAREKGWIHISEHMDQKNGGKVMNDG